MRIVTVIFIAFISGTVPAYAVQLDATIPRYSEEIVPTFQFTRIVTVQFSEGSRLAEMASNGRQQIEFGIDSGNARALLDKINAELYEKSFSKATDITGTYSAIILPQKESVSIEYRIILSPTIRGHYISEDTLDSQWRGFEVAGAVPIETEYGTYDINSPQSALIAIPGSAEYLAGSAAMGILDLELLDTSGLSELPLSKWESMFDPTARMSETEKFGFTGTIVTNYSMGICTVYLGLCQDRDHTESFEIGGDQYTIRSIESQDDGTIVIEGYVQEGAAGGIETFSVTENAPTRGDENSAQALTMYAVSGTGVAVAAGFFVWSGRRSKNTSTEQTGIDPKDLYSTPIDSSAGSYRTNRGTAHLR